MHTLSEVDTLKDCHKEHWSIRKLFRKENHHDSSIRDHEEEKVIGTCSSLPSTIGAEVDSGLLGMLTLSDILNQMSKPRVPTHKTTETA